jgi:Protein of unknown function (DUF2950)
METSMMRTYWTFNTSRPRRLTYNVFAIAIALMLGGAQASLAQSRPETFPSAGAASQALYEAVKNKDDQAVQAILGAGPKLTSSGDGAADRLERERFAKKYREMHRLVRETDGSAVLYIGAENWPFPIPLVADNGQWHFDPDAGIQEILARRVGEDEISAIQVCRASVKASGQDVEQVTGDDPIHRFARKLASTGGSNAANVQYFRGYYFRVVGKEPAALALVAYPAEYRITGVMTFIVAGGGSLYEKDLGPNTATLASNMQRKPKGKWSAVQETADQAMLVPFFPVD